ncbi:type II toxin-antitoxin system Phd/YefM family antitoxin [Streptomyces sp. AV19]|uniref:type II toxin-antitoxin system Phd/YefM family antitoxin n=1 Tax=Streptomyces sp. AV19 TaxID=2793068 RepID=UPI0018FE658B|nr:type II toxin-antitoxin system Phd/YefM family antitoxin [Streptomyces sp. AV19]MBH1935630.1 type II toxin-antitoxin system Phd/YefM family antitoxin [Streptomyces sp. AV19]MDG4534519.1 type II toxin-antitoxin system Phd/YefM family antitoxin [Streptomyces sp. AV19]
MPSITYSITEVPDKLGDLARRAATRREHIILTDRGIPTAALISPAELEDLEDALALARLQRDRALGHVSAPVPQHEAHRALLGVVQKGPAQRHPLGAP